MRARSCFLLDFFENPRFSKQRELLEPWRRIKCPQQASGRRRRKRQSGEITMKRLLTLAVLAAAPLPGFSQSSRDARAASSYKIECECRHNAGEVTSNNSRDADTVCWERVIALPGEEDSGHYVEPASESGMYTCFTLYSVYGFGRSRGAAERNAEETCEAISADKSRTYRIFSESCKLEGPSSRSSP